MREIWVLEDDQVVCEDIGSVIGSNFELSFFRTISEFAERVRCADSFPKLLIADIHLPDGLSVDYLPFAGIPSSLPILYVSSCDDNSNIYKAYALGGCDYIVKPINKNAFQAKIARIMVATTSVGVDSVNSADAFQLVLDDHTLHLKLRGHSVSLTMSEYRLMRALMGSPEKRVEKNTIEQLIWQGTKVSPSSSKTLASRLRKKLAELSLSLVCSQGYYSLTTDEAS